MRHVVSEVYIPPEDKIIDKFIQKLNDDDHQSVSSNDDRATIPTPTSYITDETRSDVLSTGSPKLTDYQKLLRRGINQLSKDRSLVFSKYSDDKPKEFEKHESLKNIQEIILGVLNDYERGGIPHFKIPQDKRSNYVFEDERYQLKDIPEYSLVSYKHHGNPKFIIMLFILNKMRILLATDTKLTKREIYYQLKNLYAVITQSQIDKYITEISRLLRVGPWALNVTAQKGLVYGNLLLVMDNQETINCNNKGTSVPMDASEICEIHSDAYFILVVEKESVFHKLIEEDLPNRLTRPFILITGKGFPDLETRRFLKKLWMVMMVPVFILVDADPYGISIMLQYRFGAFASAHISEHLATPKARWIGVFPSEISETFETMSERDIRTTENLLNLESVKQNEKIKKQLEILQRRQIKCGIEGMMKSETYLSHRYLSMKFYDNDYI